MNFSIDFIKSNKYSAVIYSVSYISPFNSLNDITAEIRANLRKKGFILFDLLLSNGDCFNRFAEAYFDGEKIILDSITIIDIEDITQLKHINAHYKGREKELNNSVLSPSEKYKYAHTN